MDKTTCKKFYIKFSKCLFYWQIFFKKVSEITSSGSAGVGQQDGDTEIVGSNWNIGCLYFLFNRYFAE